jgi:crossover junction endodeoxyribonuclease RusA
MRIVLDLPPRELSPNVRSHWAKKARAVKYYRMLAFIEARNASRSTERGWERAEFRTTWYLPDARRRDPDNLMASMKAGIDGIVQAGVLTDDRYLVIHPPTLTIDRARPRVEITIEEIAA